MESMVNDLKYAQTTRSCVNVTTLSGEKIGLTGVHEVNDAEGWVSLYSGQTFDDNTTTRKVLFDVIASVEVTDVPWD